MKLSRYEQETIVSYNAGEQSATIYTRDKAVMRKLDTLVADFPATYKLMKQDEVSKTYSFPKSFVSYRKPRAVSTEQRERARQMMIELNKASRAYSSGSSIAKSLSEFCEQGVVLNPSSTLLQSIRNM